MIETEGKTIEEVSNVLHMTPGEIENATNKISTNRCETVLDVLKDIRMETKLQ